MNKELIISSSRHETMAAILEDDQVAEVFIERDSQRGAVGNIYKGRVAKVLPGMQCAFVDIGLKREAFLYVSDVVGTTEQFERLEAGDADDDEVPARVNQTWTGNSRSGFERSSRYKRGQDHLACCASWPFPCVHAHS